MTVIAEKDCSTIVQPDAGRSSISSSMACPVASETKLTILLISLLALVVLLAQFILRDYDNNRLLSWQWIMNQHDLLMIILFSAIGFVVVYKSCYLRIPISREVIVLVVGSYFVGMATWSAPEFMVDTGRYFAHAKLIATHGLGYFLSEWGYGINAWTDMPLASVIYGALFYVFGESRLAVQIANTCLFSGSIYLTYLLGKELWDARTGVIAAWLLLAIPFLHVQASQMLVDVPAMFFSVLAIVLSIKAAKSQGNGWLLLASAAIVFALLTKYSVWIALTPIAVLPFAMKDCDRAEILRRLSLLALVTGVLLVFVFYVHHPVLLKQLKILLDYQLPALQRWQESYASTFFYQIHPFVTLAALASIVFAIRKKELMYLIPAFALGLMLVIGVYRARYLIIVFPLLTLVAAFGIRQIKDIMIRRFIARSAVAVSLAVTLVANMNFLQSTSAVNLKDASHYLNTLDAQHIVVIVMPQPGTAVNPLISVPLLDYYTNKKLLVTDVVSVTDLRNNVSKVISPLRFTWEVDQYPYPVVDEKYLLTQSVIVVISGESEQSLPGEVNDALRNYPHKKTFKMNDGVFRFQTIITVYHKTVYHKKNTSRSELTL